MPLFFMPHPCSSPAHPTSNHAPHGQEKTPSHEMGVGLEPSTPSGRPEEKTNAIHQDLASAPKQHQRPLLPQHDQQDDGMQAYEQQHHYQQHQQQQQLDKRHKAWRNGRQQEEQEEEQHQQKQEKGQDAAGACHNRVRSQSVLSTGSAGSSDGSSPSHRSSLDSTSSEREARERGGREEGWARAGSLLEVQGRLTGELIKPPDAHHESLFAPFYASDAAGPPAKKPPSYFPSADGVTKEETWWMKGGRGSGGEEEEEGNMDESLTARLRRHKREAARLKAKEERELLQRESDGGDGVDRRGEGSREVDEIQDEGREKEEKGEENNKGEVATGLRRDDEGAAMPLPVQQRQQAHATDSRPEPSPSILSFAPSRSTSSSNLSNYTITVVPWQRGSTISHPSSTRHTSPGCLGLFRCRSTGSPALPSTSFRLSSFMTYKITLIRNDSLSPSPATYSSSSTSASSFSSSSNLVQPSGAISSPGIHNTIKRYSELLRYHRLWCEQGIVPPSLKAKFPPKTLLPSTMTMGTFRTAGPGSRTGGDGEEAGEASNSTVKRARELQLYFEALVDPKEEGKDEGRVQGSKVVVESPLFWAMFASTEWPE